MDPGAPQREDAARSSDTEAKPSAGNNPESVGTSAPAVTTPTSAAQTRSGTPRDLRVSATIRQLYTAFESSTAVSAVQIAQWVLKQRPNYGNADAALKGLEHVSPGEKQPLDRWVRTSITLFRAGTWSVQLDGSGLLVALAMLDPDLAECFSQVGLLDSLEQRILRLSRRANSLADVLTPEGQRLYSLLRARLGRQADSDQPATTSGPTQPDAVPTHFDNPAEVDLLGRRAFARVLARRLDRLVTDRSGSFMLNLHGPWGSGKSTLLRLLGEELALGLHRPWVVVEFNAWQHQRLGKPWWWLLRAIVGQSTAIMRRGSTTHERKGARRSGLFLTARDILWRFSSSGLVPYLIAAAIMVLVIPLSIEFIPRMKPILGALGPNFGEQLKTLSALTGLGTVAAGLIMKTARTVAQPSQVLMETRNDPLGEVTAYFDWFIHCVTQAYGPVVVFIDDLDRCSEIYVTDLLEGIQTLFRRAPVTYVVASDRRWLCASYEKAYSSFSGSLVDPGRPMGYLFLEKLFQLSVSIPRLSTEVRNNYWSELLRENSEAAQYDLERKRVVAQVRVNEASTEHELEALISDADSDDAWDQAVREAAVIRLADAEVEQTTQHALVPFANLLDPNPRSMKRFINAYGLIRAVSILSRADVDRKALALWTILNLRWPLLGEYLADHPDHVSLVSLPVGADSNNSNSEESASVRSEDIPPDYRALLLDPEVRAVVLGALVGCALSPEAIRACATLRPGSGGAPAAGRAPRNNTPPAE